MQAKKVASKMSTIISAPLSKQTKTLFALIISAIKMIYANHSECPLWIVKGVEG